MEEALKKKGLCGREVLRGQLYWVDDGKVIFPKERLENQPKRTIHSRRPVLVLQTDADNSNPFCVTVLIAPLSSEIQYQDVTDYKLDAGQGGLPQDSIVELGLIQAINKIELVTFIGKLDAITMIGIDAIIAANLGLNNRPT